MRKQQWSTETFCRNPRNNRGRHYFDTRAEAVADARSEMADEETGACVHVHHGDTLVASRFLHETRLTWFKNTTN